MSRPILFLDIEADGLLTEATKIWCIVSYSQEEGIYLIYHAPLDNGEEVCYPKNYKIYNTIEEYLSAVSSYLLCIHNGIGFDLPLLKKLYGYEYKIGEGTIMDTLVLSSLFYPDRDGHSLEAWGDRLKLSKGNHSDWSRFSKEMLTYCIRDVDVLRRVYLSLMEESKDWDWTEAINIEYNIAHIMMGQEQHGVLFNQEKANILLDRVEAEIEEIEAKAYLQIPKTPTKVGEEISRPFKKDGSYTVAVQKWIGEIK
jgi:DNA polymerase-1